MLFIKKYYLYIILVISICLNAFFIQHFIRDNQPTVIYKDKIIEKPIKVVEVKTEYIVKTKYVERPTVEVPSGSTEEAILLERLENALPIIETEPITIVQNDKKQWVFPETISGKLTLDYLIYDLDLKIKPNVIYKKREQIPVDLGLLMMYTDERIKFTPSIMLPYTVPFIDKKVYAGIGLHMLSVGSGFQLFENSFVQFGLGYRYDQTLAPFVGMSLGF